MNFLDLDSFLREQTQILFGDFAGAEKCQNRNIWLIFKPDCWFHTAVGLDELIEARNAFLAGDQKKIQELILSEPYTLIKNECDCETYKWVRKENK